jgi:hypothetical protein
MTVLKPKAHVHWRRVRGPRQMRAALAEEARRRGRADATVVSQSGSTLEDSPVEHPRGSIGSLDAEGRSGSVRSGP